MMYLFKARELTIQTVLLVMLNLCLYFCFPTAEFLQLTNEYIHLKSDANSKLNGYWTSDIGGVNEVTHIWEYGNFF